MIENPVVIVIVKIGLGGDKICYRSDAFLAEYTVFWYFPLKNKVIARKIGDEYVEIEKKNGE